MERRKIIMAAIILASSLLSAYASYYGITKYVTSSPEIPEVACHVLIEHSSGKLLLKLKVDRIVGNVMEWEYVEVMVEVNNTRIIDIKTPSSGYVYPGEEISLGYFSYGTSLKVLMFYKHELVWEGSLSL